MCVPRWHGGHLATSPVLQKIHGSLARKMTGWKRIWRGALAQSGGLNCSPLYVRGSADSPLVFPVRALLLLVHLKCLDSGFPALLVFMDWGQIFSLGAIRVLSCCWRGWRPEQSSECHSGRSVGTWESSGDSQPASTADRGVPTSYPYFHFHLCFTRFVWSRKLRHTHPPTKKICRCYKKFRLRCVCSKETYVQNSV